MYISIKNRLIFLLIAFTVLPFLLLRVVAYPKVQADIQEIQIRNLDGIGHKQAELVTNWMHERIKNISAVANNPFMVKCSKIKQDDQDYLDMIQYLKTLEKEYGYKGMIISNNEGFVTVATLGEELGVNVSQKDFYRQSISGKIYVSDVSPSEVPIENEMGMKEVSVPSLFISAPLKDRNGIVTGVVASRIDFSSLSKLMRNLKLGKTGETYLVNKDGYMITESRFADHLREMGLIKKRCSLELKLIDPGTGSLTKSVALCVAGNDGFDGKGYKDYTGLTVLGVWRWLPEFGWGVIAEIDRDEGYGVAYNLSFIVTSVLLVMVFPIVISAFFVSRGFSVRVSKLKEVTEKVAGGDFTQRVDIKSDDEIGILANSFNTMAAALNDKTKEIAVSEKRYRELFNSIKEGIYISEPGVEGVFTFINQAGAELLGYGRPEEVIGTKVKNIYVDPEDRRRLCEKLEKDSVWRDFVSLCKRKNGESFYAERTSNLIRDEKGTSVGIIGAFRDISQRKKAELEITESEKRYRALFASLKEGVYQSDAEVDGVFTWINQAGAEILGYKSPEEVIGKKVKDIFYVNPNDRATVIERLKKEGVWKGFVSFCKRKNGEQFYMERTSNLVVDEKGKPVRIDGIFRDITERKKLEEELQKSERHHRQLLNSLKEGIYQCEPAENGEFTWINQSGAEILGYGSPEEVIGTRVKDVYVNPDDRKELISKLEKEGIWRDFTSYCKRKNGERFISETTCNLVRDENGKTIRIEGVFRDITER